MLNSAAHIPPNHYTYTKKEKVGRGRVGRGQQLINPCFSVELCISQQ